MFYATAVGLDNTLSASGKVKRAFHLMKRDNKNRVINAREFHAHFRSSECEDFGKLEPGAEVAFTLKDHRGRANAKDLKAMGRIIKVPPREEKPLEPRRQPAKKVTPDTSDAAPVSETSPSDGSENSERRAQLDRLATLATRCTGPFCLQALPHHACTRTMCQRPHTAPTHALEAATTPTHHTRCTGAFSLCRHCSPYAVPHAHAL